MSPSKYQHEHEVLRNQLSTRGPSCALKYQHELLSKQSNINTSSCASRYQHEHELLRNQLSTRGPMPAVNVLHNQISTRAPAQSKDQHELQSKQSTRAPEIRYQEKLLRNRIIKTSSCAVKKEEGRLLQTESIYEPAQTYCHQANINTSTRSCASKYQHEVLRNQLSTRGPSCAIKYQHELLSKQSNINTSSCASKYQHEHELLRHQLSTRGPMPAVNVLRNQISTRAPAQSKD